MNRDYSYLYGNQYAAGHAPNSTSFKPGQVPWNKGKRGYMGANATSFKPGVPSGRAVPIGTNVTRTRRGRARSFIKVGTGRARYAPLGWMEQAKSVWINHHSFLRDGDVVHHINGNSLDDSLENLIAIPRAIHPQIHSRWGLHEPTEELLLSVALVYPSYAEIAAKRMAQERLL